MKAAAYMSFKKFIASETGQVSTEMMMIIAVIAVAVVAALISFDTPFRQGMTGWGTSFEAVYGDNADPRP